MKATTIDKASLCNVALLGFFALGLALSFLMVRSRTDVDLSAPVKLAGEGISVALPVGTGWKTLTEWTYERDNSFTLVSAYSMQGPPLAEVRWQYRLAEKPQSAEDLLRQYAARFSGQAGEIQQFDCALSFRWIHLFPRTSNEELLLAVAVPAEGRVLLLQLRSNIEPLYLRDLFERLAASVQIDTDPRREAGKKLAEELADQIYPDWLREITAQPAVFLIRGTGTPPVGYSRTIAASIEPEESLQTGLDYEEIQAESRDPGKTSGRFRTAEDGSEFVWITNRILRRRASQTSLGLQSDRTLEIRDSYGRQDTVWPSPSAVPEILLPALARAMTRPDQPDVIVDVIASAGWIVPAILSQETAGAASETMEQTQVVIRVNFLHDAENFEEYYYDSQRNWIGKYERMPGQAPRLWKKATREELLFYFGDLFDKPEKSAKQMNPSAEQWAYLTAK